MLSKPQTKYQFQTKKTFVKKTLTHKIPDENDGESDYSTSKYMPKPKVAEDPNIPAHSEWKKGKIEQSEKYVKTEIVSSESIQVLKAAASIKSLVEKIISHKDVNAFFAESDSIVKARGTETYEAFVSGENTIEDCEELAKKNIICYYRKINYFHHSTPIFGLLVFFELDEKKNRIPNIVPETVAFGSLPKLLKADIKDFEMKNVVTFQNKDPDLAYHYWIPCFINDEHFDYVKDMMKNVLVRLSGLNKSNKLPEFEPSMVEEVLIPMFSRLLNKIYREKDASAKDIQALSYMFQLINKLCEVYPKLKDSISEKVEAFIDVNNEKVNKNAIDTFLVQTLFCNFDVFDHNFSSVLFKKIYTIALTLCLESKNKYDADSAVFALNSVSKLLVRYRETAFFLLNDQTSDDFANRYGLLNGERVRAFLKEVSAINEAKSWSICKLSNYYGDAANAKESIAVLRKCVYNAEIHRIKNSSL
jgi:hypothetical protein